MCVQIDKLHGEVSKHKQSYKELEDKQKKEKRDQAQKFLSLEDQIGQLEVENDELVDMVKELNEVLFALLYALLIGHTCVFFV